MTAEQITELTQLFVELEATVTDKKLRKLLERLNKAINESSGGVVPFVNWNS